MEHSDQKTQWKMHVQTCKLQVIKRTYKRDLLSHFLRLSFIAVLCTELVPWPLCQLSFCQGANFPPIRMPIKSALFHISLTNNLQFNLL